MCKADVEAGKTRRIAKFSSNLSKSKETSLEEAVCGVLLWAFVSLVRVQRDIALF